MTASIASNVSVTGPQCRDDSSVIAPVFLKESIELHLSNSSARDRGIPWWEKFRTFKRFLRTMIAVQGALIVASGIQIIFGFSQICAICSRFFIPLGMVPVIALVGFGLFGRGFLVECNRENVGLLGSNRIGSRRLIAICEEYMLQELRVSLELKKCFID